MCIPETNMRYGQGTVLFIFNDVDFRENIFFFFSFSNVNFNTLKSLGNLGGEGGK